MPVQNDEKDGLRVIELNDLPSEKRKIIGEDIKAVGSGCYSVSPSCAGDRE